MKDRFLLQFAYCPKFQIDFYSNLLIVQNFRFSQFAKQLFFVKFRRVDLFMKFLQPT